ncbi:MAG: RHS repeat protein [Verrucomicrobia bacterium]|nr:RHS repeat protein [Verrucomicrobiota bacterium]
MYAEHSGYRYDANGNLTNDGQRAYTYNDADRLIEVRDSDTSDLLMQSEYDGLGRRRERVLYSGGVGTTNRYVYDNWLVIVRKGVRPCLMLVRKGVRPCLMLMRPFRKRSRDLILVKESGASLHDIGQAFLCGTDLIE